MRTCMNIQSVTLSGPQLTDSAADSRMLLICNHCMHSRCTCNRERALSKTTAKLSCRRCRVAAAACPLLATVLRGLVPPEAPAWMMLWIRTCTQQILLAGVRWQWPPSLRCAWQPDNTPDAANGLLVQSVRPGTDTTLIGLTYHCRRIQVHKSLLPERVGTICSWRSLHPDYGKLFAPTRWL